MDKFEPDYTHLQNAAWNRKPARLPQYDHMIDNGVMEKLLGRPFAHLARSQSLADRREYAKRYAEGVRTLGYDVVPFERWVTEVINFGKSLKGFVAGPIQNEADFAAFPWESLHDKFFAIYGEDFDLMCETMPPGMKAVGGVGCGVFECVQDSVRFSEMCILMFEQPDLYRALYRKVGDLHLQIWKTILRKYGEYFCVLRCGDDLGFKSNTLVSAMDIRELIIPQYRRIADLIHSYNKPFLLHSCGNLFTVMDDLIAGAEINAKHSNEDEIAPFSVWVEKYGDRIGNFGGIDMNVLVMRNETEIKKYVRNVIDYSIDAGGFACGSGNSIPDYVPPRHYKAMLDAINEYRGTSLTL